MTDDEFRDFVAIRGLALRRTAFVMTGDWQLGEDVTQSAFLATWRRLDRLREPVAVEAYVRKAMATTYLSWRRRRSFAEIPVATEPETGHDPTEPLLERDRIWTALQALPAAQRTALVLRYYDDLQVQAIADALNTREGTIKSSLSRGLATLRHALDADSTKETR